MVPVILLFSISQEKLHIRKVFRNKTQENLRKFLHTSTGTIGNFLHHCNVSRKYPYFQASEENFVAELIFLLLYTLKPMVGQSFLRFCFCLKLRIGFLGWCLKNFPRKNPMVWKKNIIGIYLFNLILLAGQPPQEISQQDLHSFVLDVIPMVLLWNY